MGRISDFHPRQGYLMLKNIQKLYGKPFFFLLMTEFFAHVGMNGELMPNIQHPYYQSAGVDVQTRTEMGVISSAPWSVKSVIAMVTDVFPILGKRKLYYLSTYCIIGIVCNFLLIFISDEVIKTTPIVPAILFMGGNLAAASADLLLESKNVELMQKNPAIKSDLLSFCWFNDVVGQMVPAILVGTIADFADLRIIFIIYTPILLTPIPFLFFGGLIEDNVPENFNRWRTIRSQARLIIISIIQSLISVISIFIIYFFDSTIQLYYSIFTGLFVILLSFYFLDMRTAKWFFFLFAYAGLYINVQPALDYFYSSPPSCVPNGPHFGYIIINTAAPLLNNIMQICAIFFFQIVFAKWKFRSVFTLCISIRIFCNIADIMIINRWTVAIGIPDELVYLLGFAGIGAMAFKVHLYINSYLCAKMCPKNFEATMYALLTASGYVGVSLANFIGVYLMDAFGIQSVEVEEDGLECNFDNLNTILILGHIVFPLFSIPLVYILIPAIRLNELLIFDAIQSAQHKSIKIDSLKDQTPPNVTV